MRAPMKWLKDYVEIKHPPQKLAEMLTMAGVPVAAVEYFGENMSGVVTGKVLSIIPHLKADKLYVCKIDISTETITVVTGAKNVKKGNIVPVATVGAKLPSGLEIKETDLRGVTSEGMLCSAEELAIDSKLLSVEAREGILILPPDTRIGIDIKAALGLDEAVLEFELTANRADCFSIIGLAREIAVLTGANLKKPILNVKEECIDETYDLAKIVIEDPALCPRFSVRVFKDVKIQQSPVWLRNRIFAAGMRPINNVVDVTNFVMLEMGQPLHAFDYDLISRHNLRVRTALAGEKLTTLDNTQRTLSADTIVVADDTNALSVAGVMGGLATEVTANTKTVLLEAAAFRPASIRKASRELGLRSEGSGRFERGVDIKSVIRALDRAAAILEEIGACKVCQGIIDVYPQPELPREIVFTPAQINEHLGTNIAAETMVHFLERLEF
ncbi:MAG: phenylalanine--tRNA ligase subunit beta, partial [Sporomusaceae bacterium]|nr:phenylalanine--tRNA ligase subunit beta [Sporomusaceae bacterium]